MKNIVLLFILVPCLCFGQCEEEWVTLNTQAEADNFIRNNGLCKKIGVLYINFDCGSNFNNVDSLFNIEEVEYMEIRGGCDSVSLAGLRNLRKINLLHFDIINDMTSTYQFENLDTIDFLWTYDSEPYTDLSNFQHTENIRKIFIWNAGNLTGLHSNTVSTLDDIRIVGTENSPNGQLAQLIEGRQHLQKLVVEGGQDVDLTVNHELESIGYCTFNSLIINSRLPDVRPISHLKYDSLRIRNDSGLIIPVFENVEELAYLSLLRDSFPSIDEVFPNVLSIDELLIEQSPYIEEIGLSQIAAPEIIKITDNINLNDCNERFICEALANNPDQVIIEGNGAGCHIDTIRAYCMTVSTQEIDKANVILFPNPARDHLILEYGGLVDFVYSIYDVQGRLMRTGNADSQEIDLQDLPQGYYLLEVPVSDGVIRERFVKME